MLLLFPTEDDDADQLDYGDEVGVKGVKHNKVIRGGVKKQPPIKEQQHDGVMLIPKWCVLSVRKCEDFYSLDTFYM